jgi:hypothetical protein
MRGFREADLAAIVDVIDIVCLSLHRAYESGIGDGTWKGLRQRAGLDSQVELSPRSEQGVPAGRGWKSPPSALDRHRDDALFAGPLFALQERLHLRDTRQRRRATPDRRPEKKLYGRMSKWLKTNRCPKRIRTVAKREPAGTGFLHWRPAQTFCMGLTSTADERGRCAQGLEGITHAN